MNIERTDLPGGVVLRRLGDDTSFTSWHFLIRGYDYNGRQQRHDMVSLDFGGFYAFPSTSDIDFTDADECGVPFFDY